MGLGLVVAGLYGLGGCMAGLACVKQSPLLVLCANVVKIVVNDVFVVREQEVHIIQKRHCRGKEVPVDGKIVGA